MQGIGLFCKSRMNSFLSNCLVHLLSGIDNIMTRAKDTGSIFHKNARVTRPRRVDVDPLVGTLVIIEQLIFYSEILR
jgi:hypothetical protein